MYELKSFKIEKEIDNIRIIRVENFLDEEVYTNMFYISWNDETISKDQCMSMTRIIVNLLREHGLPIGGEEQIE